MHSNNDEHKLVYKYQNEFLKDRIEQSMNFDRKLDETFIKCDIFNYPLWILSYWIFIHWNIGIVTRVDNSIAFT